MDDEEPRLLLAWFDPARGDPAFDAALVDRPWRELLLLTEMAATEARGPIAALAARVQVPIHLRPAAPGTMRSLEACARASEAAVASARRRHGEDVPMTFYLSAAANPAAAAWALQAVADRPAELLRGALDGSLVRLAAAVIDRPLEAGVDLHGLIGQVARHYLRRALAHTGGNKSAAARLLGLRSYQTLDYWVAKYGA